MKMTIITIVIGALGTVTQELIHGLKDLEIRGRLKTISIVDIGIIEIGQNTEKSPGELMRLVVTQTPVKDYQLKFSKSKK